MWKWLMIMIVLYSPVAIADTLMIQIEVTKGEHQVIRIWKVEGNYPPIPHPIKSSKDLVVEITDAAGKVLLSDRIENPLFIRGVLNTPESGEEGHSTIGTENGSYVLRYRFSPDMAQVKVSPLPKQNSTLGSNKRAKKSSTTPAEPALLAPIVFQ
ncbi:MAG: hypothetical protein QGI45_05285 [Myxococcota bacterium]|jgi:hypothetical protein|nr:hypothetical protein [Myxococcota bacterium]